MDGTALFGLGFIVFGIYFFLVVGILGRFRSEGTLDEGIWLEIIIKGLFGDIGLRIAFAIFGLVLIIIGLFML